MPHIIILIYDADGNEIGQYIPEHDPETGGRSEAASVEINKEAFAKAIAASIGSKSVESISVKFTVKKK